MRERIARALVRWVGGWMDRSYTAYCENRPQGFWNWGFRRAQKFVLPVAVRLDRRNAAEQMAREGWWG